MSIPDGGQVMKLKVCALAALAALSMLSGCNNNDSASGQARVSLLLTDTPIDLTGVEAVNVTISSVTLYPTDSSGDDSGGIELSSGPIAMPGDLTLNLLDFRNGQTTFVGETLAPAVSYNRIRLQVVSAELVRDDDNDPSTPGVATPITVPSGKVDVTVPFTLTQGDDLAITLDFDAQASVQVNSTNGQPDYLLRPVINVAGMR
jgi:hypothetical protein